MNEVNYSKLPYYRTKVPIFRTQDKLKIFLQKFNLQGIRFTEYQNIGIIEFILLKEGKELMFRFKYDLPKEQFRPQIYRGLFHYLKNRFLAIEFGIITVEKEFLQELVIKLPDGSDSTVKDIIGPNVLKLQYNDLKMLEE